MPPLTPEQKSEQLKLYREQLRAVRVQFPKRMEGLIEDGRCKLVDIKEVRVISRIGEGSFAAVYEAEIGDQKVAIKVQEKARLYPNTVRYAILEKQFLSSMDSLLIPRLHGKWQDNRNLYMYLDFAMYGDIEAILEKTPIVPEARAVKYISQIVAGLEYVHACNVVHRDMKPENCFIYQGSRVKIGDFGLACICKDNLTSYAGTRHYISPEMHRSAPYDDTIDWWAVGVMMFEMLIGVLPFGGIDATKEEIAQKVQEPVVGLDESPLTAEAKDLIRKFLTKDPKKRLGAGPNAATVIMDHPWFKNVDFYSVIFDEFLFKDSELEEIEGEEDEAKKIWDGIPERNAYGNAFDEF